MHIHLAFYLGEKLEMVECYKYLGTSIDSHLNMDQCVNQLSSAASRALGSVIGKTRSIYDLNYNSFDRLFHACVAPILDYSSGAWSTGTTCHKIDQVQHRAARFFLGLPKKAPLPGVVGETGWTPSIVRRDLEVLRLYNQIVKMTDDRLTKQVLNYDINQGDGAWSDNVKSILMCIGKMEHWNSKSVVNIRDAQKSLMAMYEKSWLDQIASKPKLRSYRLFKNKFETEPYVWCNQDKWKRSLLSRLRCGVSNLSLESGRFKKLPVHERICELCKSDVEDEFHFLFNCSSSLKIRNNLLVHHQELLSLTDSEKILNLSNKPHTLGKYVSKLWQHRAKQIK